MSKVDLNNLNMPRMRMADGVMHCHPQHGVEVSVMIPAETRALTEEAMSMLQEVKRLLGKNVESIEQTTESADDSGVNVLTFTFSDGTTRTFKIRNGSAGKDGEDGNLPEIEEAIAKANAAAAKVDDVKTLKEAYKSMVVRGLADNEEIGTIEWSKYDPAGYVAWDRVMTLGPAEQLKARNNIGASSENDMLYVKSYVKNILNDSDALVGPYSLLDPELKVKLQAGGFDPTAQTRYVYHVLNWLFENAGLGTTLGTTAQTTNEAVNELHDAIPDVEDSDINMATEVFI